MFPQNKPIPTPTAVPVNQIPPAGPPMAKKKGKKGKKNFNKPASNQFALDKKDGLA
jgi:hypothetical protein